MKIPNSVLNNRQIAIIVILFFSVALLSKNVALTGYAFLVLLLILKFLWLPYQPAIFMFGLSFQWMQSCIRVFQANFAGQYLNQYDGSPNASAAVGAALTSTLVLTLVLAFFLRKYQWNHYNIWEKFRKIDIRRVFRAHLILFLISPVMALIRVGGLSQILVSIESLKWIAFVALAMSVFIQRHLYILFFISFSVELIIGFTGFFSGFKNVIFYTLIALLSIMPRVHLRQVALTAILSFLALTLALFWTSIKGDYRQYVSGGQRAQIVTVSTTESLKYIISNISSIENTSLTLTFNTLMNRLQYTQMIQLVMDYVPYHLEHQQGRQWKEALSHIFQPRLLFPNKPALDDSAIASKYTGMLWAGAQEGTSISIGFVAESYVDFGIPGMFIPIAALAVLIGFLYCTFSRQSEKYDVLFYISSIVLFFRFNHIEISVAKILGGLLTTYLVYMVVIRPLVFPVLWKYITKKS